MVCVCVCVNHLFAKVSFLLMHSCTCSGLECITEVSSQRRRFCACSVNVPADQFLGAVSAAGLVNNESQALFFFPKQGFQAVMSATVHVKHVSAAPACQSDCVSACQFFA